MSWVYCEPFTAALNDVACSPENAWSRPTFAPSGSSVSLAAAAVSPLASASKNFSATGPGPSGRGVHATAPATSSTVPTIARTHPRLNIGVDAKTANPQNHAGTRG
ncbi:Uncharacterised protein [Mycobacteroides abscessus subsp. abscessus]|nr:Uncharacterised protein [Mycobacteroides abscessus subsp. abscessus]